MIFRIWHFTVDMTQFVGQRFLYGSSGSSVQCMNGRLYGDGEGMAADQFSLAPRHTVRRETLYTGATGEALNSKPGVVKLDIQRSESDFSKP